MMRITSALKTKKIGVLMGGWSTERSISLKTGKAIEEALEEEGFRVVGIDVNRKVLDKLKKENIDLAFIALHGAYGEDGIIQGTLELLGIPYTGSGVLASALAMDKIKAKEIFAFNKIPTPDWQILNRSQKSEDRKEKAENRRQIEKMMKKLGFPVVIKPSQQGSTVGVTVVDKIKDIDRALKKAFKYSDKVIIEKYIAGMEITVGIIDNTPLPVMEIVPKSKFYDYSAKYTRGMCEHIIPARLPSSYLLMAQKLALMSHKALGCRGVTRVDLIVEKGSKKLYVLEVNTIPGMTRISLLPEAARAIGMDFNQLVVKMLRLVYTER